METSASTAPDATAASHDPPPLLALRGGGRRRPGSGGDGRSWLWRSLDLEVRPGELLVIAGPTGSGKSLLLRSLACLDPLDEGTVHLEGRPADGWPITRFRHTAVYLHQSPALFPGDVEDNLREPFEWEEHRGVAYDRGRVLALLEPLARDASFLERPAPDLSGGERQILAIVRAMLLEPRVLLLDEPTAALDPGATGAVERLVRSWIGTGRSALWVTHDRAQARRIGDRCLLLEDGRLRPLAERG